MNTISIYSITIYSKNNLYNLFKKLNSPLPEKILGRWNLEYSRKKIDRKIDLANEDHCGPCGNYKLIHKFNTTKNTIIDIE
jgi:hypothetical protein